MGKDFKGLFLVFALLASGGVGFAQSTLTGNSPTNTDPKDTSMNKSNTGKWKNEPANVSYEKLNSGRRYTPDTTLHTFQRPRFTQPWYRDLGNIGSPVNNMLFTPEDRLGPTLGYHIFDVYRFNTDSLNFYNTNRPYSVFTYQLGSKLEQCAGLMHTQNVKPNWNFAFEYRKINSPGYYKIQRNNTDNASLSTNYKSINKHYTLYAAMVYNKEQHDENGGIVNFSELSNPAYSDRKTVDAAYQNEYSITRSPVTNMLRDFTFLLQHSYTWGRTDTTYNEDSTHYTYRLKPAFSITHKMEMSTEKHVYKDLAPDSMRYTTLFAQSFINNGSGYYTAGEDSVFTQQKWFWIDNKLLLNGYIGKTGRQLEFSAGLGDRFDQFISQPIINAHDTTVGLDRSKYLSNYLTGEIKKEALAPGQWEYGLNTKFFITGADAGNFVLKGVIGKNLHRNLGSFAAGFQQQINSAPYSYTNYENVYAKLFYTFNNESVTTLFASFESQRLRLSGGVRNYVINNYIYINDSENPAQYTVPFSITQAWIRKVFKLGNFYLDNEFVYQTLPDNAPVSVPAFMGRHQLSYEHDMFKHALKIVVGIEVRYNSSYYVPGYDALLNRFYYQKTFKTEKGQRNAQEEALFLNFRIKRFRAFVMGDNLQQLFARNTILYTGTPIQNFDNAGNTAIPIYAAPNAMIRFGFNWVLVN